MFLNPFNVVPVVPNDRAGHGFGCRQLDRHREQPPLDQSNRTVDLAVPTLGAADVDLHRVRSVVADDVAGVVTTVVTTEVTTVTTVHLDVGVGHRLQSFEGAARGPDKASQSAVDFFG